MTSGSSRKTIGELCDLGGGIVKTGPFGSQLHQSDYSSEGTPVVMPTDILCGRIDERRIARVSQAHVERLFQHKLRKGDIVYGRRGDIGRQALVREENIGWLCGTGCLRITLGDSEVDPEYLHRYLMMSEIIGWVEGQAVGATMPNLNTDILRRVPVSYPSNIATQRKIAAVLTTYDDLIEANKHRVALIEKMAEELYREWFVRMRYPEYEKTKLVKGMPEGWETHKFSDLVELNPRESVQKDDYAPHVGMENLSETSMYFLSEERRKGAAGSKFRNRDVLLPRITPCLENGKRGFVMCLEGNEVGIGSTEFIVIREKVLTAEHIYLMSCSNAFRQHAELSMTGASGRQRVQQDCFTYLLVKTPPEEIRKKFSQAVAPIFKLVFKLVNQNTNLAKSRDLLLPRLISGKVSVDDLDIQFPPSMLEESPEQPRQEAVHA